MSYLSTSKYRKEDFIKLSWEEYGKSLDVLFKKVNKYIQKNNIKVNAVVPILRGGAFPGTYLAYKLNLLRILPVQYRYFVEGKNIELKKVFGISKKGANLPDKPTFLLVENNHCFGVTAQTAVNDLKEVFPNCKIIYVADNVDYSYQKMKNIDASFYGKLTNECRVLSEKECKEKGIFAGSYLFPWESLDEEWTTVQGKQFPYKDLEEVRKISVSKIVMKND